MRKKEHLAIAELCFVLMQTGFENRKEFWECMMYESLFEWAGWQL